MAATAAEVNSAVNLAVNPAANLEVYSAVSMERAVATRWGSLTEGTAAGPA